MIVSKEMWSEGNEFIDYSIAAQLRNIAMSLQRISYNFYSLNC